MPQSSTPMFLAPEQRITTDMRRRLEQLAPLFHIHVERRVENGAQLVEFSGAGFSEREPVVLASDEAVVRLLAEICSILTRWIPFNLWEPCEVTLFALAPERVERCATTFRKQLAQQTRAAEKAAAQRTVQEAVGVLNKLQS